MSESFYISCALGFEEVLAKEIKECWPLLIEVNGQANQAPLPEMVVEKGGILIKTALPQALQLNFFLKTANRILWRLAEFKVRDFPKLFEKVQKIQWVNILAGTNIEWVVAASKSRLNNEKRIEETCSEAFSKISSKIQGNSTVKQEIFVRMYDDNCSISLDSTGEHLHKRGWGAMKGEAPLRETIAAFLMRQMMVGSNPDKMQEVTIVDPMCGSGTMVLEAASLFQPVFARPFAFLEWKNAPKLFKTPLLKKNYKLLPTKTPFKAYLGFDLSDKVLEAANENLKALKEKTDLPEADIRFANENLYSGEAKNLGPVWCISNPPYGERLFVQGQTPQSEGFSYEELLQKMATKFNSEKVGVLLPSKPIVKTLKAPKGFKKVREVPFSNGGLDVLFLIFAKN